MESPEVTFSGRPALSIGNGFEQAIQESDHVIQACSILSQHVHLVVKTHTRRIKQIVGHLKGRATQQLAADNLHPLDGYQDADGNTPSPWSRNSWPVFLFSTDDTLRAIKYVEENPLKEGKPPQKWSFVTPYERE